MLVARGARHWERFHTVLGQKSLTLMLLGCFTLTQRLTNKLANSSTPDDPARVVNVGSVMGEIPMGMALFIRGIKGCGASNDAYFGKELADQHITVNALAPGPFQSGMTNLQLRG